MILNDPFILGWHPSKHDTLPRCCWDVEPASKTMGQHKKWDNVSCLLALLRAVKKRKWDGTPTWWADRKPPPGESPRATWPRGIPRAPFPVARAPSGTHSPWEWWWSQANAWRHAPWTVLNWAWNKMNYAERYIEKVSAIAQYCVLPRITQIQIQHLRFDTF